MSSFSCFSLNARGLRDNKKRKSVFLFCKSNNDNLIFLQETHSTAVDERFWINQWGDKVLFDHGSTSSAGVAILFHNSPGKIISSRSSGNGHWLLCILEFDGQHYILINIYGFNNTSLNKKTDVRHFQRNYKSQPCLPKC